MSAERQDARWNFARDQRLSEFYGKSLAPNDFVEACGQMADAMNQGTAVHRDQADLTAAVNGARTRRVGDAWALDRTSSLVDVSPFVAVTLARWALLKFGPLVLADYDVLDSVY